MKKERNKVVNMLYFQDAILHQKPSLNCIFWQTLRHFVKQYLVFHDHSQFYLAKETCCCYWNSRRHNVKMKKHKFVDHPVSACLPAMARVVGKFPSAFHLLFLRRCTMWSKPFWSSIFIPHIHVSFCS